MRGFPLLGAGLLALISYGPVFGQDGDGPGEGEPKRPLTLVEIAAMGNYVPLKATGIFREELLAQPQKRSHQEAIMDCQDALADKVEGICGTITETVSYLNPFAHRESGSKGQKSGAGGQESEARDQGSGRCECAGPRFRLLTGWPFARSLSTSPGVEVEIVP